MKGTDMFARIVTAIFSIAVAVGLLFESSPIHAQTAPTTAPVIANDRIPELIWHFVPSPVDQVKVVIAQLDPYHPMPQGGFLLKTIDGSKVKFRRQQGDGRYRIEFDARNSGVLMHYPAPICTQDRTSHHGSMLGLDPRDSKAELRYFDCEGTNTVEIEASEVWIWEGNTTPKM